MVRINSENRTLSFFILDKAWKVGLWFFYVGKSAESWTLSFFMSEKVRKFGLFHFLGRKKCGNLNFVIFYVEKSAECWILLFLLAKKFGKLDCGKRCGKLGGLVLYNLIQPTISLEMPVSSQGHYSFHSFPVVDWFCLFIYFVYMSFDFPFVRLPGVR